MTSLRIILTITTTAITAITLYQAMHNNRLLAPFMPNKMTCVM